MEFFKQDFTNSSITLRDWIKRIKNKELDKLYKKWKENEDAKIKVIKDFNSRLEAIKRVHL